MPWLRWDTAILFDEFCDSLTSDEFRAWSYTMLYVKATGARGSAPYQGHAQMAKIAHVPVEAVQSMFAKAGDRFTFAKGRIGVKNWHRYQEDYRDKSVSPEIHGDTNNDNNGLTPPHPTTTRQDKKLLVVDAPKRDRVDNSKDLHNLEFVLRLHENEFSAWVQSVQSAIRVENDDRRSNPFTWRPQTGSLESDLRGLIYRMPDDTKTRILYDAYNILGEKLNWPNYVLLAIQYAMRTSRKTTVHSPYKFILAVLQKPGEIVSARTDGILSGLRMQMRA